MSTEPVVRGLSQLSSDHFIVVPKTDEQNHYFFIPLSKELNKKLKLVEVGKLSLQDNNFVVPFKDFLSKCPKELRECMDSKLLTAAMQYRTSFEVDQLLRFLNELTAQNSDVPLQDEFPQVMSSLVLLTTLIKALSGFSIMRETFPMKDADVYSNCMSRIYAKSAILKHFDAYMKADTDLIIPVCSSDHCAYLLIRQWKEDRLIVAICDGGAGRAHFFQNVDNDAPLNNAKSTQMAIYCHCVYVFKRHNGSNTSLYPVLEVIGSYWLHFELFRELSECFSKLCIERCALRLDGVTLYQGKSIYFRDQELFVVLQKVGNCAVHNLLLALRLCACLYGNDRDKCRHEYNKLTFLLYFALYVAWINNEDAIEQLLLQQFPGDKRKGQVLLDSVYKPILLSMRKKYLTCGGSIKDLPEPFQFAYTVVHDGVGNSSAALDVALKNILYMEPAKTLATLQLPLWKVTLEVAVKTIVTRKHAYDQQIQQIQQICDVEQNASLKQQFDGLKQSLDDDCDKLFEKVGPAYERVDGLLSDIENKSADKNWMLLKTEVETSVHDINDKVCNLPKNLLYCKG